MPEISLSLPEPSPRPTPPTAAEAAVLIVLEGTIAARQAGLPPSVPSFPRTPEQEPRGCRWIMGDVDRPGWRYCQGSRRPGSSYCPHHHDRSRQWPEEGPG
ncbi:MAG: hypothetical protein QF578_14945 [Alphaproteobacteria bacterium]|jgi:hypothetical protein|nr:hypothetical protein [Alphaproteobacteria bacterium]MDP6566122.1 hypothetical protein [Alphaproteobacteria bacterium]MDP6813780.1 hypothetical protein [Alphaproteobacteria bacterium]